jgi:hypothetical protein
VQPVADEGWPLDRDLHQPECQAIAVQHVGLQEPVTQAVDQRAGDEASGVPAEQAHRAQQYDFRR